MNDAKYIGLDGKTISHAPYRRGGSISLDIPFYRARFSESGPLPESEQDFRRRQ
jgi:hypothetical protein